jgi:Zn-dependent peptidase ImmA (M78 family)/transcriptional regulator with XRE-family HTH domain
MATYAHAANPEVLRWARERTGRTLEEVADILKKEASVIAAWESKDDETAPAYGQLEKLAESVYKLPLAVFFFPSPPAERLPDPEFRTLPTEEIEALPPDTRFAIREASAVQESLRELTGGENPAPALVFEDLLPTSGESVQAFCNRLREYLGVDLETQVAWKKDDDAFKAWRSTVESRGVFVLKRSFKDDEFSGFCLRDKTFPVICINNGDTFTRQSFTLFHELAHILLDVNGVTKRNDSYLAALPNKWRNVEVRCNRIAAELLVPSQDLSTQLGLAEDPKEAVQELASRYNVSREVVMRRLLDRDLVSQEEYEECAAEWNSQRGRGRGGDSGGGNYYATTAAYLGDGFLNVAFSAYHEGRCSLPELAEHLHVKAQNIGKLEATFVGRRE